jgi:hypothetical protein
MAAGTISCGQLRSSTWRFSRRDSSIDIGLPLWPAKLVVPISPWHSFGCASHLQLWGYGRAFGRRQPVTRRRAPARGPDVSVASREAETVSGRED